MRTIAAIQARLGSTRLPDKVLADLNGQPMVMQIARRLRASTAVDEVVLATTTDPSDDRLADEAARHDLGVHRGAVDDLVERLLGTADAFRADVLVRVWGDCPCVDPGIVTRAVQHLIDGGYDFVSTMRPPGRTLPLGLDIEVYRREVLAGIMAGSEDPFHREFPVEYVNSRVPPERVGGIRHHEDVSELQVTVDYPEDLAMARAAFSALDRPDRVFSVGELVTWMRSDAGRAARTDGLSRNADYQAKKAEHGSASEGPGAASS